MQIGAVMYKNPSLYFSHNDSILLLNINPSVSLSHGIYSTSTECQVLGTVFSFLYLYVCIYISINI